MGDEIGIKLSIIIPVFNVEEFVERCLLSILDQGTFCDQYEVIVVDDGSTDSSLKVATRIAKEYDNVHVYEKENSGVGPARNLGLEKAKGEYIWFVDSDDFIESNFINKIIPILSKSQIDVLSFSFQCCNENGEKIEWIKNRIKFSGILTGDEYYLHTFKDSYLWANIYRSNLIKEFRIRFKEIKYMEDSEFIPRVLLNAKVVIYLDEIGINYVKRYSSATNKKNNDSSKIKEVIRVFALLLNFKKEIRNHPKMKKALTKKLQAIRVIIFSLFLFEKYSKDDINALSQLFRINRILPLGILYHGIKPYQILYNIIGAMMSLCPVYTKYIYDYIRK